MQASLSSFPTAIYPGEVMRRRSRRRRRKTRMSISSTQTAHNKSISAFPTDTHEMRFVEGLKNARRALAEEILRLVTYYRHGLH